MGTSGSQIPTFRTRRGREAYDIEEVDKFVERVTAERLTADEVQRQAFAPVRLRAGYDMGDVDGYLDEVAQDLRGREAAQDDVAAEQDPATVQQDSTTAEQDPSAAAGPTILQSSAGVGVEDVGTSSRWSTLIAIGALIIAAVIMIILLKH